MNFSRLRAASKYVILLFLVALFQPAAEDLYNFLKELIFETDFESALLVLGRIVKSLEFWSVLYAFLVAVFIYFRSFSGYFGELFDHLKKVFLFRQVETSVSGAPLYLTITVPIVPAYFFNRALEIFLGVDPPSFYSNWVIGIVTLGSAIFIPFEVSSFLKTKAEGRS